MQFVSLGEVAVCASTFEVHSFTRFGDIFEAMPNFTQSRRKNPRTPWPGGGGLTLLRGPMLRMKKISRFFNVFKISVKIFVHNEIYR